MPSLEHWLQESPEQGRQCPLVLNAGTPDADT